MIIDKTIFICKNIIDIIKYKFTKFQINYEKLIQIVKNNIKVMYNFHIILPFCSDLDYSEESAE